MKSTSASVTGSTSTVWPVRDKFPEPIIDGRTLEIKKKKISPKSHLSCQRTNLASC